MSVDAMRPAEQVYREIIAALEVMRPLVDHVPEALRRPVDLTGARRRVRPDPDTYHRASKVSRHRRRP
jgi:hypothetical protein